MIYVKVVNFSSDLLVWHRIQGGFFIEGGAMEGTYEAPFGGSYQVLYFAEGVVYSLPISGQRAGRLSAILYDRTGWGYVNSQQLLAGQLKDGLTYLWDLTLNKLMAALPRVSLGLPSGLTLPAGEPFTIPLTLTETAGEPGQLRLLHGGATLWERNIAARETLTLSFNYTMPYDNLALTIEAEAMEPVQGTWHSVGSVRRDILAGFPRLTLRLFGFPEVVAAGKDYKGSIEAVNEGFKGEGRLLQGSTVLAKQKFEPGERRAYGFNGVMPYDDVLLGFRAQSLGRNQELVETGSASVPVKAGFPDLRITAASHLPSFIPGEMAEVKVAAVNAGYVGDVQLDITDTLRQEKVTTGMKGLAAGGEVEATYTGEMPPAESWSLLTRPQWVGRNKAIAEGVPSRIDIAARNALFQYSEYEEQRVRFLGGEATNRIGGVIAADQLSFSPKFQALTPPEIPGLPQAAAFALDLEPGAHEEVTFTNLRYFRMESEQEIAIVKNGQLVARKSSSTESGTLPAFAFDMVAIFATTLTRQSTKVT